MSAAHNNRARLTSAGTGAVVLKVVPVMGAAFSGIIRDHFLCASLFPLPPLILYSGHVRYSILYCSVQCTESIGGCRVNIIISGRDPPLYLPVAPAAQR